ncbi:hypothetical protein [Actinomycetospora sp. NBRC 106378]|uniref:hypothetical protein n=1 Tax=Actinomycetospora sp. NBRC 106378 TaxID=3032208 RepID=UPI0024A03452|nr:hypothetical protein [Actinomycetospora sp. NBRC 106378]GLZ53475.1 hypothetical protein Acsp07_30920 [Actinomycetospora sp. NBRC 106378]
MSADTADFVTVDAFTRPAGGFRRWRTSVQAVLSAGVEGLRAATTNRTNDGTHSLVPHVVPGGAALVAAWDSPEAAAAAWRGPLGRLLVGRDHFSLDGEVVRVRTQHPGDDWYGWSPSAAGAREIERDEPLVVIVHGVLRPRCLPGFLRNNLHAASRAAHHPGHRGSVDISSDLPFEHTSVSLWSSAAQALDYAYAPGGHAFAMKHAVSTDTHRTGVFLRIRPLASAGGLGLPGPAYPDLRPTRRTDH